MFIFFSPLLNSYGMVGGCFTDVMLHSSKKYHQEHATEPRRLTKDVVAALILRFQSALVLICARLKRKITAPQAAMSYLGSRRGPVTCS